MTGEELRRLRKRLGLTQVQLAARLGTHWNTLARWERNEHRIPEAAAQLTRLLVKMPPARKGGRH